MRGAIPPLPELRLHCVVRSKAQGQLYRLPLLLLSLETGIILSTVQNTGYRDAFSHFYLMGLSRGF
jgi:hypothetical protein